MIYEGAQHVLGLHVLSVDLHVTSKSSQATTTFSDSDMPLWVKNLLISLSLPGFPIRQSSAAHCLLQLCDFAEEKCEMSKNVCFGLLFIAVCQCVGFRASPTSQFVTSKK